ncbi:MAG: hypothetical protein ABW199_01040 [Caulobacterales bacterium]
MKITCLALAGLLAAAPAFAQTPPSVTLPPASDQTPVAPESKPPPPTPDSKKETKGNETGWGGNLKTDEEGKADPKRNEVQGPVAK